MALKSATVWGQETAAAIKAIGVVAGTPVNDTQLELVWKAIKEVTVASLGTGNVAPGTFATAPTGGAVTGIGGPVS